MAFATLPRHHTTQQVMGLQRGLSKPSKELCILVEWMEHSWKKLWHHSSCSIAIRPSTTGVLPSSLFLHRVLRIRLDLLRPDVGSRVRKHHSRQKMFHDQCSRHYTLDVNEHVWVWNFRDGPHWKKGVVAACVGPVSYVVRMPTGALWRQHCDHIRRGTTQALVSQGDSNTTDQFSFSACSPSPPSADGNNHGLPLSSSVVTDTTCSEELSMLEHSTGPPMATARLYPECSRCPPDCLYGTLDT